MLIWEKGWGLGVGVEGGGGGFGNGQILPLSAISLLICLVERMLIKFKMDDSEPLAHF